MSQDPRRGRWSRTGQEQYGPPYQHLCKIIRKKLITDIIHKVNYQKKLKKPWIIFPCMAYVRQIMSWVMIRYTAPDLQTCQQFAFLLRWPGGRIRFFVLGCHISTLICHNKMIDYEVFCWKRLFPKQKSQLKLTLWQNKTFNHGCWSLVLQRHIVFILWQIPPPACSAAQPHVNETESRHWIGQKTSNQETTHEVEKAGLFTVCCILISICSLTLLPCLIWTLKKLS